LENKKNSKTILARTPTLRGARGLKLVGKKLYAKIISSSWSLDIN
tara:strand:+ start:58 stop:192 length:135 start_codon:yes stop_codon:yes gene_type:complete